MKKFVSYRTYLPNGTRGIWYAEGKVFMRTIEPPQNREHPCIQEGTFIFERFLSPKHGNVFRAKDVIGREGIEVHIVEDVNKHPLDYVRPSFMLGCIGPGLYDCVNHDEPAVCGSIEAFRRFNEYLQGENAFTLQITSQTKEIVMDPVKAKQLENGKNTLKALAFAGPALITAANGVLARWNVQLDPQVISDAWSAGVTLFTIAHLDVIPWVKKFYKAIEASPTQPVDPAKS